MNIGRPVREYTVPDREPVPDYIPDETSPAPAEPAPAPADVPVPA